MGKNPTFVSAISEISMLHASRLSARGCSLFFTFLSILILSGCSSLSVPEDEYHDWTDERFYNEAKKALTNESYKRAIELYENLETRFPFGRFATQAQLDIAFAYYKSNEPDAALAAADRFIKLHPRNPHVDYAYYLKGLVNYNRSIGFLERFIPTDSSQRDPGAAKEAFKDFQLLMEKFPNSRYNVDARQRMVSLRNNLAMNEIHVARYYMKRRAYVAAADRSVYVIENFQQTPAVPFALKIMEAAYKKMAMNDLAADASRVFELNYADGIPNTEFSEVKDTTVAEDVWDFIGLDED